MARRRENSASAGLVEVKGTWGDAVVGSLIKGRRGTLDDVWEIIEVRNPAQYDPHMTGWFLSRNLASKVEAKTPPGVKTRPLVFMVPEGSQDFSCPDCEGTGWAGGRMTTQDGEPCERCEGTGVNPKPKLDPATQPARTYPADHELVDLLVRELGATEIAVKDHETGEIHCPPYEEMVGSNAEMWHHLQMAHDVDMSNVELTDTVRITTLHGESHSPFKPHVGKGGFPHRHVYKTQATEAG